MRDRVDQLRGLADSVVAMIFHVSEGEADRAARDADIRLASFIVENIRLLQKWFGCPLPVAVQQGRGLLDDVRNSTRMLRSPVTGPTSHVPSRKKQLVALFPVVEEQLRFGQLLIEGLEHCEQAAQGTCRKERSRHYSRAMQIRADLDLLPVPCAYCREWEKLDKSLRVLSGVIRHDGLRPSHAQGCP